MSGREDSSQIGTQMSITASQIFSQLSDPSLFNPKFVSTPKKGNKEDRSGLDATVQPGGGALTELVK